jgi:tellurite resistance protein TehA-like permease
MKSTLLTGLCVGLGALVLGTLAITKTTDSVKALVVGSSFLASGVIFTGFSVFGFFYYRRYRPPDD